MEKLWVTINTANHYDARERSMNKAIPETKARGAVACTGHPN